MGMDGKVSNPAAPPFATPNGKPAGSSGGSSGAHDFTEDPNGSEEMDRLPDPRVSRPQSDAKPEVGTPDNCDGIPAGGKHLFADPQGGDANIVGTSTGVAPEKPFTLK